jgi:hypothetical protein
MPAHPLRPDHGGEALVVTCNKDHSYALQSMARRCLLVYAQEL